MNEYQENEKPLLIVEDSEDDFEIMVRAFKAAGYTGHTIDRCDDGLKATEYLDRLQECQENKMPAFILLDLNLPGISGYEVLAKIKNNEQLRSIPVIIFSTSDNEADVAACYDAGANNYVTKPVAFKDFINKIKEVKNYWLEHSRIPEWEKA